MTVKFIYTPDLITFLIEHRDEIVRVWVENTQAAWNQATSTNNPSETRLKSTSSLLDIIIGIIQLGNINESGKTYLSRISTNCIRQNIDLGISVDILLQAKDAILTLLLRENDFYPQELASVLLQLDQAIRIFVSFYTKAYANEASRALVEERENFLILQERQRIAREVHDNLSQVLGFIKLKCNLGIDLLDVSSDKLDPELYQLRDILKDMVKLSGEAYVDAREVIFALRNTRIVEQELLPTLEHYINRYRTSYGVNVILEKSVDCSISLSPLANVQALRIIQEALTNIRKHANSTHAWVGLEKCGPHVVIQIRDDGQGFDVHKTPGEGMNGSGLAVMHERANSVGGQVNIESHPDAGTCIIVTLPALISEGEF